MSNRERSRRQFARQHLDEAISATLMCARRRQCERVFLNLLHLVQGRSVMLRVGPNDGRVGWEGSVQLVRGLLRLAEHKKFWLRQPETWDSDRGPGAAIHSTQPFRASEGRGQFASLARHLLANQPLPEFMHSVWWDTTFDHAAQYLKLYRHLAKGYSVRGAELPLRLTKEMARHFPLAPHDCRVDQALRWCQIRGWGGSEAAARALVGTLLGTQVGEHEDYWAIVIPYLLRQPRLVAEPELLDPVVEYLHENRAEYLLHPAGKLLSENLESLLARVRDWSQRPISVQRPRRQSWPPTAIGGFKYVEPSQCRGCAQAWTIRELLDNWELIDEGTKMSHCVATYADVCLSRDTSIWSLQRAGVFGPRRVLTIEVDPRQRKVITALGKGNSPPRAAAREVLRRWASEQRLSIACWV